MQQHKANVEPLSQFDVVAERRRLADQRMSPERQVTYWLDLWRQWPDTEWGNRCMDEAERVMKLLHRETTLRQALAEVQAGSRPAIKPAEPMPEAATRHFVWLGIGSGVRTEHLRDGIAGLARAGMVATDRRQQDALRLGLGITVNDDERHTDAPWVRWLGPADMLWLLVTGLWEMGLITCAGGIQQKWRTATSVFVRADGSPYGLTLKNSRCTNADKQATMRDAILGTLAFVSGRSCPCVGIVGRKT